MSMTPLREWEKHFLDQYLTHENIAKAAYREWEERGRPDGEQFVTPTCPIKVKEVHWSNAKMILECLAETDAYFLWATHDFKSPSEVYNTAKAEGLYQD